MASMTATMTRITTPWWLILIEGIAAVILGILLLLYPTATLFVLIQFLGIWWLVSGILDIVSLFIDRTAWGWKLLSGIVGIIAGIVILQHPLTAAIVVPGILVLVLGILGLVQGILGIIGAFQGGGWVSAVFGVISIIFGLILIGNAVVAGFIALPLVLGVFGLIGGAIGIYQAFQVKKAQNA
jgi:uncharacterized membrane protein HdeD (DUF308 family)